MTQKTSSHPQVETVARALLETWRKHQAIGAQGEMAPIQEAIGKMALLYRWDEQGDPIEWLAQKLTLSPEPNYSQLLDNITTEVIQTWLNYNGQSIGLDFEVLKITTSLLSRWDPKRRNRKHSIESLFASIEKLALLNGKCEGVPFDQWLYRKAIGNDIAEKTILADILLSISEKGALPTSLIPLCLTLFEERNPTLHAKAVACIALQERFDSNASRLLSLLLVRIAETANETFPLPLHLHVIPRQASHLERYFQDITNNSSRLACRLVDIALLGRLPETKTDPNLVAILRKECLQPYELQGFIAAESLLFSGHALSILQENQGKFKMLLPESTRISLQEVVCLASLPSLQEEAYNALFEMMQHTDLFVKASVCSAIIYLEMPMTTPCTTLVLKTMRAIRTRVSPLLVPLLEKAEKSVMLGESFVPSLSAKYFDIFKRERQEDENLLRASRTQVLEKLKEKDKPQHLPATQQVVLSMAIDSFELYPKETESTVHGMLWRLLHLAPTFRVHLNRICSAFYKNELFLFCNPTSEADSVWSGDLLLKIVSEMIHHFPKGASQSLKFGMDVGDVNLYWTKDCDWDIQGKAFDIAHSLLEIGGSDHILLTGRVEAEVQRFKDYMHLIGSVDVKNESLWIYSVYNAKVGNRMRPMAVRAL